MKEGWRDQQEPQQQQEQEREREREEGMVSSGSVAVYSNIHYSNQAQYEYYPQNHYVHDVVQFPPPLHTLPPPVHTVPPPLHTLPQPLPTLHPGYQPIMNPYHTLPIYEQSYYGYRPVYQPQYHYLANWNSNHFNNETGNPIHGTVTHPIIQLPTQEGCAQPFTRSDSKVTRGSSTPHTGNASSKTASGNLCPFCPNAPRIASHMEASHLNQLFECRQCRIHHGYVHLVDLKEHWKTIYGKEQCEGRFPENLQQSRCNMCPQEEATFLGNGQKMLLELHIQSQHPTISLSRPALVSYSCRACPSLYLPPSLTQEQQLHQHIQQCHAAKPRTEHSEATLVYNNTGHPPIQLTTQPPTHKDLNVRNDNSLEIAMTAISIKQPVTSNSSRETGTIIAPKPPAISTKSLKRSTVSISPLNPAPTISPKIPAPVISPNKSLPSISPNRCVSAISSIANVSAIYLNEPLTSVSSNTPIASTRMQQSNCDSLYSPSLPKNCKNIELIELDLSEDHELLQHRVDECPFCPPRKQNWENMEHHLRSHKSHLFSCAACGVYFTEYGQVKKHVQHVHRVTDPAKVSESVFLPKDVFSLIIFECNLCRTRCIGQCESVMATHVLDSHLGKGGSNTIRRMCRLCKQSFPSCSEIQAHVGEVHPLEGFAQDTDEDEQNEEGVDDIAIIEVKEGNARKVSFIKDIVDKVKEKTGKTSGFLERWEKETSDKLLENDRVNKRKRLGLEYVNIVTSDESSTSEDVDDENLEKNKNLENREIKNYVRKKTRIYHKCKRMTKTSSKKSKCESPGDEDGRKEVEAFKNNIKFGINVLNNYRNKVGSQNCSMTDLYTLKNELKEILERSRKLNKKCKKVQEEKNRKSRNVESDEEDSSERINITSGCGLSNLDTTKSDKNKRDVTKCDKNKLDVTKCDTNNKDKKPANKKEDSILKNFGNHDTSNRHVDNMDAGNSMTVSQETTKLSTSHKDNQSRDTSKPDDTSGATSMKSSKDPGPINVKEQSKKDARSKHREKVFFFCNSQRKIGNLNDGKIKKQNRPEHRKVAFSREVSVYYGNYGRRKVPRKPFTLKWKKNKT